MTTATLHRSDLADTAVSIDPALARWARTGKLSITYDQLSDSLTIHRFGRPVPSLVEPVDSVLTRLVSLEDETEETGVLIEGFLAVAVQQRPWLSPIAKLLKLPERPSIAGVRPSRQAPQETAGAWSNSPPRLRERTFVWRWKIRKGQRPVVY